jgi:hypothetical protein
MSDSVIEAMPTDPLLDLLQPVLDEVARLQPQTREDPVAATELQDALESAFPSTGEIARAIGAELHRGIAQGWLCNRGSEGARFSRVAKPSPRTRDLSVDVVALEGPALRHKHPRGEVTLGFAAPGSDQEVRFDGHRPGWVFMAPGSTHTPTVTGGRMHLLYFLPGGAVEWEG